MWRFLALALVAAPAALARDAGGQHEAVVDASEAATEHSILSNSMQDYLNQISQLEIQNPSIAVPGEWLTDAKKSFIFLPIRIPKTLPLDEVKLLTDGRSILVNVVERPAEAPEDEATKKFRLILDSFKEQTKGNEQMLVTKLEEWDNDEDNSKVKDLIRSTLGALHHVNQHGAIPKAISVPLNTLELQAVREKIADAHFRGGQKVKKKQSLTEQVPKISNPHGLTATIRLKSTYLQEDSKTSGYGDTGGEGGDEPNLITIPLDAQFLQTLINADYVEPLHDKDAFSEENNPHEEKPYIKESFSITLPYPTQVGRIFAVLQTSGQLVVCMPYSKGSKAVSQAFARMPVFDMDGKKLIGQGANSADLAPETSESHGESHLQHSKAGLVAVKKSDGAKAAPAPKEEAKSKEELISVGL
jgi:hypothetical protein